MKAWDLTRCSSHASRPSQCPAQLNEQHRSPRRYGYTTPLLILEILQHTIYHTSKRGCANKHIPRASTVAMFVDYARSLRSFEASRTKRQVNAHKCYDTLSLPIPVSVMNTLKSISLNLDTA